MTARSRQAGQQLMELALVMPVFITLVVGGVWLMLGLVYLASGDWAAQKAAEAGTAPGGSAATATAAARTYLKRTLLGSIPATDGCMPGGTPPQQRLWLCVSVSGSQSSVRIQGWVATGVPVGGGLIQIDSTDAEPVHSAYCSSC